MNGLLTRDIMTHPRDLTQDIVDYGVFSEPLVVDGVELVKGDSFLIDIEDLHEFNQDMNEKVSKYMNAIIPSLKDKNGVIFTAGMTLRSAKYPKNVVEVLNIKDGIAELRKAPTEMSFFINQDTLNIAQWEVPK